MEQKPCCQPTSAKKPQGFWSGLAYGLIPHTFCILFIIFSIIGSVAGAAFAAKFLVIPYFFQFLIGLSLVSAILSAFFYLRRSDRLNFSGIKQSWKYLTALFSSTVAINLLLFFAVFPAVANIGGGTAEARDGVITLQVDLPCSGHAPLVSQDLLKQTGVKTVNFELPDKFVISYDKEAITADQILQEKIFQSFKAKIAAN